MGLLLGYHDLGCVKSYKKQFVISTFSCFLFPVKFEKSFLVDKEKALIIKRNRDSIIKTFFWIPNTIVGFLFLILIAMVKDCDSIKELNFITFYLVVALFLFLLIYPNFIFGRTTKTEKIIRNIFYSETGYTLMPNWISEECALTKGIIEKAEERYLSAFKTKDYSQIMIGTDNPNFNQYFVYISLKAFVYNEERAKEIYLKLIRNIQFTSRR